MLDGLSMLDVELLLVEVSWSGSSPIVGVDYLQNKTNDDNTGKRERNFLYTFCEPDWLLVVYYNDDNPFQNGIIASECFVMGVEVKKSEILIDHKIDNLKQIFVVFATQLCKLPGW